MRLIRECFNCRFWCDFGPDPRDGHVGACERFPAEEPVVVGAAGNCGEFVADDEVFASLRQYQRRHGERSGRDEGGES